MAAVLCCDRASMDRKVQVEELAETQILCVQVLVAILVAVLLGNQNLEGICELAANFHRMDYLGDLVCHSDSVVVSVSNLTERGKTSFFLSVLHVPPC